MGEKNQIKRAEAQKGTTQRLQEIKKSEVILTPEFQQIEKIHKALLVRISPLIRSVCLAMDGFWQLSNFSNGEVKRITPDLQAAPGCSSVLSVGWKGS